MSRAVVFLTHSPDALANYYGPRALAALQALAAVKRLPDDVPWTASACSAASARGP